MPCHPVDKCFKLHGYPPGYDKNKGKQTAHCVIDADNFVEDVTTNSTPFTQAQYQHLVSLLVTHPQVNQVVIEHDTSTIVPQGEVFSTCHIKSSLGTRSWIIDSGATAYIAASLDVFSSHVLIQNSIITLPDHTSVPVHSIGSIKISNSLHLTNVLHIPDFWVNLIYVPVLLQHNSYHVIFDNTTYVI